MNLTIVLPIYNEEEGIRNTTSTLLSKAKKLCSKIELIAVDDGSTDKTGVILTELQQNDKRIKIITHKTNRGYGAAFRSGIDNASYDWIFFTDADMQFDIDELEKFLRKTNDYDFIVGYRKNRADPLRRKILSFFYNRTIRLLFGLHLKDVDCAFKLMNTESVRKIPIYSNSFFVSVEFMVKAFKMKYRITEIGVEHFPRTKGFSKVTPKQMIYSISDLLKLYRSLL